MEVLAILWLVVIPTGVICLFLGFFLVFRKIDVLGRIFLSIAFSCAMAVVSPYIISIPGYIGERNRINEIKKAEDDEFNYFMEVVGGKYTNDEIYEHYKLNKPDCNRMSKVLLALNTEINPYYNYNKTSLMDNLRADTVETLIAANSENSYLIKYLAVLPQVSHATKKRIAESDSPIAVDYLSINPKTPPDILMILATHPSTDIAWGVYNNKSAPVKARYIYAIRSPFPEDGRFLVGRDKPPGYLTEDEKSLWESLSVDNRDYVRTWVARSTAAPPQVLTKMRDDKSNNILMWIFLNTNTPFPTKKYIANKKSISPEKLLQDLAGHENAYVRRDVAKSELATPDLLAKMIHDKSDIVLQAIANNPQVTSGLLQMMSPRK